MADLSITAGNVTAGTGAVVKSGSTTLAGETITAGMAVYLKSSDSKYYKAQNDGTSAEAAVVGIALTGSSSGQPISVQTGGPINAGGTVAVGETYYVSANAGGIAPYGDIGAGDYVSIIGVGITASSIQLGINVSRIQKA